MMVAFKERDLVLLMIVLDLEWNSGYDKTPLEEILQIGAVRLDKLGGTIQDTFSVFVHPCVHRKLNRTAKALPELHASLHAPYDFPTALELFVEWCGEDRVFADWGGDDFLVLRQNCEFWQVPVPHAEKLIDLQAAFSMKAGTNQGVALFRAVEYCGIPTPFTFHNALNDAMYTALLTAWISQDILDFLALPKEIRRLSNCPDFPPQPCRNAGTYLGERAALSSRNCRRVPCPVCGEITWVRRWFPGESGIYYADFRCKAHGSFLCRLTLTPAKLGQLHTELAVPPITSALLQEFHEAIQKPPIPCKPSGTPKKRRHLHRRRAKLSPGEVS